MKPTTDGRWAHLACAIWIPGSLSMWLLIHLSSQDKLLTPSFCSSQKLAYQTSRKWSQLMG